MPATFLIFLALLLYIILLGLALLIYTPMLFIKSKKLMAKKVIATVVVSFPCLVIALLLVGMLCAAPGLLLIWLASVEYISGIFVPLIFLTGILFFIIIVIPLALYLWYFVCKILYLKIDNKSVAEFINNDKVFNFVLIYLKKFRIINYRIN